MFRPPAGDAQLRHGYTVSQVRALSLAVVTRQTWYQSIDFDQRLEVAWHAIIEHIYTSDQPPEPSGVLRAAAHAVGQDVQQLYRFYGRNSHDRYAGTVAGFERYWWSTASPCPGPESTVIDRVALAQIWPRLRPEHREVLTALTVYDDYGLAAAALGISRTWFTTRLSTARREFLKLWHEGEPPSRPWARDVRGIKTTDRRAATNRTIATRRRARNKAQNQQPARPRPGPPRADLRISDAELARRYQAGESIRQLAGSLGTYYSVVQYRLKAEGTQLRPANGQRTRLGTESQTPAHLVEAVQKGPRGRQA